MSHKATINHLKLANCAIDQCYTSKLLLLAQVCSPVRLYLHCTTSKAVNIAYDTAIPIAPTTTKNLEKQVMEKTVSHFLTPLSNQIQ